MRIRLKIFLILFTLICAGFGIWFEKNRYEWRKSIPVTPLIHRSDVAGFPDEIAVEFRSREITYIVDQARKQRKERLAQLRGFRNLEMVTHLDPKTLEDLRAELLEFEKGKLSSRDFKRASSIAEVLIRRHQWEGLDWLTERVQQSIEPRQREHLLWLMSLRRQTKPSWALKPQKSLRCLFYFVILVT